mmetsp:Transcript_58701/g.137962  ORF Transcript_58701/g.137962 Transcript_58701/m.137962 type:complete len:279 (-) Transcript_58701:326-1162(-)|eukprot:3423485-Rhodomonas_salina.3
MQSLSTMTAKEAMLWRQTRSPEYKQAPASLEPADRRASFSNSSRRESFRRMESLSELKQVDTATSNTVTPRDGSDAESVLSGRSTATCSTTPLGRCATSPKMGSGQWGIDGDTFSEDSESSDGRFAPARRAARASRAPLPAFQMTPREDPYAIIEPMPAEFESIISKARHARYKEVQELIAQGAPINAQDSYGNTTLHAACQGGSTKTAKVLLREGCETNIQNLQGNTPLHLCFAFGYDELGEYLIRKGGADISIRNACGALPREGLGNKAPLRPPTA